MTNLKIYNTLDEALKDIQFENGLYKQIELKLDKKREYVQPPLDKLYEWLYRIFKQKGTLKSNMQIMGVMLADLVSNAYRHGVEHHPNKKCLVETYIGNKGILFGTKQNIEFLEVEQIKLLKEGKPIPSTNVNKNGELLSCNHGTRSFVEDCKGILIIPSEKRIYVSKYFLDS